MCECSTRLVYSFRIYNDWVGSRDAILPLQQIMTVVSWRTCVGFTGRSFAFKNMHILLLKTLAWSNNIDEKGKQSTNISIYIYLLSIMWMCEVVANGGEFCEIKTDTQ